MPFQCSKCEALFKTRPAFIRHIGQREPCWLQSESDITIDLVGLYNRAQEILELLQNNSKLTERNIVLFAGEFQKLKCTVIPQIRAGIRLLEPEKHTKEIDSDLDSLMEQSAKYYRILYAYRKKQRKPIKHQPILETVEESVIEPPDNIGQDVASSGEESGYGSEEQRDD